MLQADFVWDEVDAAYDTVFVTTGVLGFDVTETVGVYVEGVGLFSTDGDVDPRGIVGFGATWALRHDIVLDVGVNAGLTSNALDYSVFSGITVRF